MESVVKVDEDRPTELASDSNHGQNEELVSLYLHVKHFDLRQVLEVRGGQLEYHLELVAINLVEDHRSAVTENYDKKVL